MGAQGVSDLHLHAIQSPNETCRMSANSIFSSGVLPAVALPSRVVVCLFVCGSIYLSPNATVERRWCCKPMWCPYYRHCSTAKLLLQQVKKKKELKGKSLCCVKKTKQKKKTKQTQSTPPKEYLQSILPRLLSESACRALRAEGSSSCYFAACESPHSNNSAS